MMTICKTILLCFFYFSVLTTIHAQNTRSSGMGNVGVCDTSPLGIWSNIGAVERGESASMQVSYKNYFGVQGWDNIALGASIPAFS